MNKNYDFHLKPLDSAGFVFPFISDFKNTNVFRISVALKIDVEKSFLEKALTITLNEMKSFQVKIRKGLFWHYFEYNTKKPMVFEEDYYPCSYINKYSNNEFLFKVSYFKCKINLDVFHVLTDGGGAMEFLKKLIKNYLSLIYPEFEDYQKNSNSFDFSDQELMEDSFKKYIYNSSNFKLPADKMKKTYIIKGIKQDAPKTTITTGRLSIQDLIKVVKKNNTTITSYLASVFIWSIYKENYINNKSFKPIEISIPVDLRKFFPTNTNRNFFACVQTGVDFSVKKYKFEEILSIVTKDMRSKLNKEYLSSKFEYSVVLKKKILVKCIPLFIKNFLIYNSFQYIEKTSTASISNLGEIKMEYEFSKYIDNFDVIIYTSKSQKLKNSICSFGDNINISFNSSIYSHNIEKCFFRFLADQNLDILISSNQAV